MDRVEAIKYLIEPVATSTEIGEEKQKEFEAYNMGIEALSAERTGEWIDCQEDGYVECPFCGHATTCEDNKDELHFCFYCGAKMKG